MKKDGQGELSPMMKQYKATKEQYSDAILMYRLGDFYEMFFEDAEIASKVLELTLTGRDCGLEKRAPMCGVPFHAVDSYISKLVSNGYKVAICEQLTDPKESKDLVERDVVRVITAGTVIDDGMVSAQKSNYIVAIYAENDKLGFAWADITTGEFNTFEETSKNITITLDDFFAAVSPSEIISNAEGCEYNSKIPSIVSGKFPKMQAYFDWSFKYSNAEDTLKKAFAVATLDGFEITDKKLAVSASGALMEYMLETQKRALPQFGKISYFHDERYMVLDATARRNLEIFETLRDRKKQGSLLWVLDKTCTNMGARNLRKWIDYPSQEDKVINSRLDAVQSLVADSLLRETLKDALGNIYDLERLAGKCAYGNVNPSDMCAIAKTLKFLPIIRNILDANQSQLIKKLRNDICEQNSLAKKLELALDEEHCGATIKDGGFIREGYSKELDEFKNSKKLGKEWLAALESTERESTGIRTLKVGFNKVFGYYIEVSKSFVDQVPYRYHRKQTLVNGERYITDELKNIEEKLLYAEEKALTTELSIFEEFKNDLLAIVPSMLKTANAIAALDTLLSFAEVSIERGYVRPIIGSKIKKIEIENGRHPVVEAIIGRKNFTANGTLLDSDCKTMVITGPNMAGKSTYMRQVALITLMAHIGCFVPATKAEIAITDRIFTRIGASDDLTYGQSTFMVEMVEVATILNNATPKSLLILDEIGRGTSTYDGLGIAWSVMEYLGENLSAKTLFATHYHELTELEGKLSGVKNYRILANEIDGKVVFLHKIVRGGANKSFGIEVAALAGVPELVVKRAKEVTKMLEDSGKYRDTNEILIRGDINQTSIKQASLFEDNESSKLADELSAIDINSISPMQAFAILSDLIERAKK